MVIKNKIYIRLHDFDCSFEDISSKLHLSPTGGGMKGTPMSEKLKKILRKQNTWELKSSLSEDREVEDHVEDLLDKFEPCKQEFKELVSKYEGELAIVSYLYGEYNPGMGLNKSQIKRIAELGLYIDFDLYFLSGDSEDSI